MKQLTILIFLTVVLSGCYKDKFFELKNPPEFPWQSVREFEMAVTAPYNKIFYTGWGGSFVMSDKVIFDAMTDIIYLIPGVAENWPHDEVYYRQTTVRNEIADQCFESAYKAINNINFALDYVEPIDNPDHPFGNIQGNQLTELKRQIGELHFLRAFSYFHLVMRHCPAPGSSGFSSANIIPFRNQWTFNTDTMRQPPLASGRKVIEEIVIPDLQIARAYLPLKYTSSNHASYQFGRADQLAAYAMSSRVFLWLKQESMGYDPWDSAYIYSDYVITNAAAGGHDLSEEPIIAFSRSTATLAKEVLWEGIFYDTEYPHTPKDATMFTWNRYAASSGWPDYTPNVPYTTTNDSLFLLQTRNNRCTWHTYCMSFETAKYIDWIDKTDSSQTLNAANDKRYKQLYLRVDPVPTDILNASIWKLYENKTPWVLKPQIWCHKYFRGAKGDYSNVPVIRLPEMYLTRAITALGSRNHTNAALALSDINVIRARAGLTALPGPVTEEDIHKERIKELAFEGDRLLYLIAIGQTKDSDGVKHNGIPPGDRTDRTDIPLGDARLYWQLPLTETQFYE